MESEFSKMTEFKTSWCNRMPWMVVPLQVTSALCLSFCVCQQGYVDSTSRAEHTPSCCRWRFQNSVRCTGGACVRTGCLVLRNQIAPRLSSGSSSTPAGHHLGSLGPERQSQWPGERDWSAGGGTLASQHSGQTPHIPTAQILSHGHAQHEGQEDLGYR